MTVLEDHSIYERITIGPDFIRDPFPLLKRLREAGPVHPVVFGEDFASCRWLVTRYADVKAGFGDPRLSSQVLMPLREKVDVDSLPLTVRAMRRADALLGRAMANVDPPDHTRLRALLVRAFSAKRMDALRPRVEQVTDELLDAVGGRAAFDVVASVAYPVPIQVLCELLGVPPEEGKVFRAAARVLSGFLPDDAAALECIRSLDAFEDYIRGLIVERRARPSDDLLSDLIRVQEGESRLTDEELVAMAALMIFAGHETTLQLIANGVLALLTNPDQLMRLRANPDLLPNAVEETLRFDGPANPGLHRYVLADVEIGGVTIPAGSHVMLGTASANRDPAVFDSPDSFDVTRRFPAPPLAFGFGLHYCLGARLAKIEGEVVIGALLRRFPSLRLAAEPQDLPWRPGFLRGLIELPVSSR